MNNERTTDGDILIPPVECSEEGCTHPDWEKCKDCRYRWEPWFTMKTKKDEN